MGKLLALLKIFKNIATLFSGAMAWSLIYISNRGDTYKTANEFHKRAQDGDNKYSRLLSHLISNNFSMYSLMKENVDRDRISSAALVEYNDDSLSGYGDVEFTKGGSNVKEQQRGLVIPVMEKAIEELSAKIGKIRVVEIGTGNGDVVAHLAAKYPSNEFAGVDFSVRNASEKHRSLSNLGFIKGYALDLLESGSLSADILFASSTFIIFTPKETDRYIELISKNFKQIVLNEPTWANYPQTNDNAIISRHLEGACWYHNWCGYLRKHNCVVDDFNYFSYKHPVSPRPDIKVCLLKASTGLMKK